MPLPEELLQDNDVIPEELAGILEDEDEDIEEEEDIEIWGPSLEEVEEPFWGQYAIPTIIGGFEVRDSFLGYSVDDLAELVKDSDFAAEYVAAEPEFADKVTLLSLLTGEPVNLCEHVLEEIHELYEPEEASDHIRTMLSWPPGSRGIQVTEDGGFVYRDRELKVAFEVTPSWDNTFEAVFDRFSKEYYPDIPLAGYMLSGTVEKPFRLLLEEKGPSSEDLYNLQNIAHIVGTLPLDLVTSLGGILVSTSQPCPLQESGIYAIASAFNAPYSSFIVSWQNCITSSNSMFPYYWLHEMGHRFAYKSFGTTDPSKLQARADEFFGTTDSSKFKARADEFYKGLLLENRNITWYGVLERPGEAFAEAFVKYLLLGEVLDDKGEKLPILSSLFKSWEIPQLPAKTSEYILSNLSYEETARGLVRTSVQKGSMKKQAILQDYLNNPNYLLI